MLGNSTNSFRALFFMYFMISLTACSPSSDFHSNIDDQKVIPQVGTNVERLSLPQGWSDQIRRKFWFTSQGSRIIPYSWFTWLEQANSEELFRAASHFESLRYLPIKSSPENPAGLPIGFVMTHDTKSGQAWMGMTCAACHTNQVNYQGHRLLIDGAPTLGNFVLFYRRLVEAMNQTYQNDQKFERFAKKVLSGNYSTKTAADLRSKLSSIALAASERLEVNQLPENYPRDFTSYARLDAFGNIQNAGTAFALHDLSNRNAPTGPVSYPFLWGTHQSDVVQWNASAPNTPVVGPLARNVGEVIGVFGGLSIDRAPWWKRVLGFNVSYSATVDIDGLGRLESHVKILRSPQWPSNYFPKIDISKAAVGAGLFASECQQCHQVIARENEGEHYIANKIPLDEIGTDPVTARNADRHCAETLILQGSKKAILAGDKFGSEAPAISIPVNGAIGLILKQPGESLMAGLRPIETHFDDTELEKAVSRHGKSIHDYMSQHIKARNDLLAKQGKKSCEVLDTVLVYKARPLNGIWATAPYLHNGSVPNLWELLKKGAERTERFWVGSREFDPVNVGYSTSKGLNEFRVKDSQGQIRPGNSNLGHEYGTDWTDEQKWSVIEYMKTL